MKLALQLGTKDVVAYTDSQLMAQQFGRTYEAKETSMVKYLQKVRDLQQAFGHFELHQVPREKNKRADALSKLASTASGVKSRKITLLVSKHPENGDLLKDRELQETKEDEGLPLLNIQTPNDDLRASMIRFLQDERSADETHNREMRIRSARFTLSDGELYKRTPYGDLLKCVNEEEVDYILR
ncbi:UNVERIFIED_CONTAM: hypothetical protein Slati_4513500 [Sesamum latifolium]|uniref:RNase H type-1 domain-containing protein n=1 Tax=Sesamum latifolium TaxID=2727402 RepID=A0AAW2SSV5_9LAMI